LRLAATFPSFFFGKFVTIRSENIPAAFIKAVRCSFGISNIWSVSVSCAKIAMHRSISWADRSFMFYLFHHHVKGILCLRKFQGRKYSLLKSERLKIKQSKIKSWMMVLHFRHLSYYLRTYNVLSKMHEAPKRQNFRKLRPFCFHLWESICNKKYYAVSTQIIFTIPLALKMSIRYILHLYLVYWPNVLWQKTKPEYAI
jgi:hypothetical protein